MLGVSCLENLTRSDVSFSSEVLFENFSTDDDDSPLFQNGNFDLSDCRGGCQGNSTYRTPLFLQSVC
jgi:hypothetical protein